MAVLLLGQFPPALVIVIGIALACTGFLLTKEVPLKAGFL